MLPKNANLRHVELAVNKFEECEQFYNLLGLQTELKTPEYIYLSGNGDNITLYKTQDNFDHAQRLKHIGFALDSVQAVDQLFVELEEKGLNILGLPKTIATGSRAFSVLDPDGIEVEFTYHPPMWGE